jgi:hypothetical protein
MRRASESFAKQVSRRKGGGLTIPSAEGGGISRSKKSLEEGLKLAEENVRRLGGSRPAQ